MAFSREDDYEFIKWAQAVKKRDFFTCQICYASGVELNSHHLNGWNWCVEERYDIDNGQTLCVKCHDALHQIYGKGYNTKAQYKEFEKFSKTFNQIAEDKYNKQFLLKKIIHEVSTKIKVENVNKKIEEDGYGTY